MVDVIVAFGATESSFFISSENQTHKNELPSQMDAAISTGIVRPPYHFASIGHGGRFFISGGNTPPVFEGGARHANTLLHAKSNSTTGITFGDGGAWAWFDEPAHRWQSGNIRTNTNSWIRKTTQTMGKDLRPILGAGNATVLLYPNGKSPHINCSPFVSNVLHAAEDKGLLIRYLALSPSSSEWFFVQFADDSIMWHTTGTHGTAIGGLLHELADTKNIKVHGGLNRITTGTSLDGRDR